VVDAGDLLLGQADRDELGERPALTDYPERAVGGIDQFDGGLHDPPQRRLQVKARADRHDRLKQAAHLISAVEHRLQPALQLGQQLIEPELRQNHRTVTSACFHRRLLFDANTTPA
jgi:hypothetical protein